MGSATAHHALDCRRRLPRVVFPGNHIGAILQTDRRDRAGDQSVVIGTALPSTDHWSVRSVRPDWRHAFRRASLQHDRQRQIADAELAQM